MTYRAMDPLHVPDDFWDRADVVAALPERDFTELFVLLRRYLGASQTKIAAATGLTQSTVSMTMRGRNRTTAHDVIGRIAAGLTMPDRARVLLGLAPADPPVQVSEVAPSKTTGVRTVLEYLIRQRDQTYAEVAADVGISERHLARLARGERNHDVDNVHPATRRALQAAFGLSARELLRPWQGADGTGVAPQTPTGTDVIRRRRTVGAETYAEADSEGDQDVQRRRLLRGFATLGLAGSFGGTEQLRRDLLVVVGGESVNIDEWDEIAWEYGCSYATTPPAHLLDHLTQDLLVAHRQLALTGDPLAQRPLQRVVAQLAVFLAQTMGNLGDLRASRRWWRFARHAADASTDAQVCVWVRGREIIRALYENRPLNEVLDLADEATAITAYPGMGTGSVLIGRAQALAVLGRTREARDAMTRVYTTVDRLPAAVTGDVHSMYGWPEYRLRHGESFVYTYISDAPRAEAAQDKALSLYPPHMFRERAQVQLHQAMRLVRTGDHHTGITHARTAVDELPNAQRIEAVLEVARSVVRAVPATEQRSPGVVELKELLALPPATPRPS